jgi:putative ATP-dependent endonuclease of OLD family
MRLVSATFHNYRTLRDAVVPLRRQTILVGANNTGKSSILDALDGAFGISRRGFGFTEEDVSQGVEPTEGLTVLFELWPDEGAAEFSDEEVQTFAMHVDVGAPESQRLFLKAVGRQEDDGVFRSRMHFEKSDGLEDGSVGVTERELIGFLLLPAVRDGRREFYDRSGLWAKLAAAVPPSDEVGEELARLGRDFAGTVLEKVLGEEKRDQVANAVGEAMGSVLYAGDASPEITFTLVPADPADTLRAVEMRIGAPGDAAPRRVSEHSVGTQSVAVVGLFSAYLGAVPRKPLALGIEEPEAHLHPHATRAMVRRLGKAGLQTIVTTHSTTVTDAADPRSIVVLRRRGDTTIVSAVPGALLDDNEAADVRRRIADAGTEFLFARLVLLTEGPSERTALPLFAAQLGWDFDVLGVSVTAVGGGSFKVFLKLLGHDALDIPHIVLCDNDAAAKTLVGHLEDLNRLPTGVDEDDLPGSRATMASAGYFYWPEGALEKVLIDAGAAAHFVATMDELWPGLLDKRALSWGHTGARDDPEFLVRAVSASSKPQIARRVAERMGADGMPVPPEIVKLLTAVHDRAVAEARVAAAPETPLDEPRGEEPDAGRQA